MDQNRPFETPEVLPLAATFTPSTYLIASLSVAVLFLALLFFFNKTKSGSRKNALLLVGPPDAGKTAIFSKLVYSQYLPTHTSLQTNQSVFSLSNKKQTMIIDVPGHPRLRDQFQEHLVDSKAIAFVVDSSTVSRNAPVVAEHLHSILHALTSLPPSQKLPSLLILAHKADLLKTSSSASAAPSTTLAINRVKTILERELEKRRASQVGGVGVEGLGAEGERSDMGGLECGEGGTFKFEEWEGGEVIFLGTSVRPRNSSQDKGVINEKSASEDGLEALEVWLEENI
ncbi:uncharacterized protein LACBIDRAFT_295266 [Laccaria bicolor S238N-H82]|uniref:Signal recognition particle receptor subunit beta n=1 Tax=Laccaria bicolor (strain S238N-H82 / ATCC MYA-4686) TaxID=486041 RepID=B0DPY4_LACBS|nr:uncharacterized protein LACBIDRAFT_295266 [Laccaria bicolor S238N-H82]EDR03194.1 predicted protein [Laccaria bicolor S238N-H82]|eukprot:XP_001885990.1 predicted protein [Laccaria bicolor S238N-H82]